MTEVKTKKAVILRDFKDANDPQTSAEKRYTKSKDDKETADVPEGVFDSWVHAGLIRAPGAESTAVTTVTK